MLKAGKKWEQLSNWVRGKKIPRFVQEKVWMPCKTGNCWSPFFLPARLCCPCLRASLTVAGKLAWWTESVFVNMNGPWGQTGVSTPKETTLGAAVVEKKRGQAPAQGKLLAECEKLSGICTNLDGVDSSLEEFVVWLGPAAWFGQQ